MNLIVLSLTYTLCKCQVGKRILREGLAALCGAIAGALLLLFAPGYGWAVLLAALLVVPAMVFVAFGWNGKKDFFTRLLVSWLSIVVLNGVAEALQNLTGIRAMTFYGAILVLFVARLFVGLAKNSVRRQGRLYAVTLCHRDRSVKCLGLYDSGNLLTAADGEPVHIASPGLFERLGLMEEDGMTLVPFAALGTKEGWIRVVRVEKMQIGSGRDARILSDVWLGKADRALLAGKSYQMILNGAKGVIS